jgi:hypothetical protein
MRQALTAENPTKTDPHRGIRFFGGWILPKRHQIGFLAEAPNCLTTSEKTA